MAEPSPTIPGARADARTRLIAQLAADITAGGEFARQMDPATKGSVCYPAMCGVLESIVCRLAGDLAGPAAREQITEAFKAAYREAAPDQPGHPAAAPLRAQA